MKTHSDGREKMSDVNAGGSVDVDEAESWVRSWVPIRSTRWDTTTSTAW